MRTIFLSGLFLVLCQLTQSTDLTKELNKVLSGSLDLTKESYFQAFVPYQLKVLRYYFKNVLCYFNVVNETFSMIFKHCVSLQNRLDIPFCSIVASIVF